MEEKHEIITPNFVSKPSTTAPISATYKHIAAKVEFNGIHLTIFKDVNPKLASELVKVLTENAH